MARTEVHIEPLEPTDPAPPGSFPCLAKRNRYLYGDCAPLALAIQRRTGWPPVSVNMHSSNGHVMAQLPDGRLLDAGGFHDPDTGPLVIRGPFRSMLPRYIDQRSRRPDVQADAEELLNVAMSLPVQL